MNTIAKYVDHAAQFEEMARLERDEEFKAILLTQAVAYRKLAEDRARKLNLEFLGNSMDQRALVHRG
jgi:hypothetical protein